MVSRPLDPVRGHSLPEVSPPPRAAAAVFSPCGGYRWWLQRTWEPQRPPLLFVGLNPSRADGQRDDPTLRRLMAFARRWGFGRLEVLNLFGAVATRAAALKRMADPVGADNDAWIRRCLGHLGPWRSEASLPQQSSGAEPMDPAGALLWLGWGNGGAWGGARWRRARPGGRVRGPAVCPAVHRLRSASPSFVFSGGHDAGAICAIVGGVSGPNASLCPVFRVGFTST